MMKGVIVHRVMIVTVCYIILFFSGCQSEKIQLYLLSRKQDDKAYFNMIKDFDEKISINDFESSVNIIHDPQIKIIPYEELEYILINDYYYTFQSIMDTILDSLYNWQLSNIKDEDRIQQNIDKAKTVLSDKLFDVVNSSNKYQELAKNLDKYEYKLEIQNAVLLPYEKRYSSSNGEILRFEFDTTLLIAKMGDFDQNNKISNELLKEYWYFTRGNADSRFYIYYDIQTKKVIRFEEYCSYKYRYNDTFTERGHFIKDYNKIYDDYLVSHKDFMTELQIEEITDNMQYSTFKFLKILYGTEEDTDGEYEELHKLCSKRLNSSIDINFLNNHKEALGNGVEFAILAHSNPVLHNLNTFLTKYGDFVIQYDYVSWDCQVTIPDNYILCGKDEILREENIEYKTIFFMVYEDEEYKIDNWYTFVY